MLKVMPWCQKEPYAVDKVHFKAKAIFLFTKLKRHWDLNLEFQMLVALRVITTSE